MTSRYNSKTGCDDMGMCCKKKTMIRWRNIRRMEGFRPRSRPRRSDRGCAKRLSSK